MRVLFATPELAPWVKSGGLGDVSQALPVALAQAGADIRVLLPYYPALAARFPVAPVLARLSAQWGELPAACLREIDPGTGPRLWCLDCPELYARPGSAYQDQTGRDFGDNARRFALLARVAALLAGTASPVPWRPDIVQGNDWPLGLVPAYAHYAGVPHAPVVMAVHNLAFQGNFALSELGALGLPPQAATPESTEYFGQLSFLKAGLQHAEHLVTVSPRYAREILDEAFGYGLAGLLRWRQKDLSGILNGIDTTLWNPAQDTALAATYDAANLMPKSENTRALRQALKLDEEPGHMLIGMVGRLTEQKGVDLVLAAVADILALPAQLAVLGTGDRRLQEAWRELAARHPGRVAAIIGFDETLAHRIEAGADLFLMPSRFEPCGLNQMYSMRYGTPPVVHAVGGLADTVVDASPANLAAGSATGFCFFAPEAPAMLGALRRAQALWVDRAAWRGLMVNGMRRDFGWAPVAEAYLALYRRLVAAP